MADPRDLIQRLADELDHCRQLLADDCRVVHPLAAKARACLATPKPAAGPTPKRQPTYARRLAAFFREAVDDADGNTARVNIDALLDAAELLEASQPPQPIPLSERLPTDADCDDNGSIWLWCPDINGHSGIGQWERQHRDWATDVDGDATHWLPHHALPGPEVKQ